MTQHSREAGWWPFQELPESWEWVPFDVLFVNETSSSSKLQENDYKSEGEYPVIDQGEEFIGGYTNQGSLLNPAAPPTIVFGDHTRAIKFVPFSFVQGADGVKVFSTTELVDPKFAYWSMKALRLPDKGYSRHYKFLRKSVFPVPPITEQRRIVLKIEELHSNLDDGVKSLQMAKRQLERYRLSVLQAAVEGRLTGEWRRRHSPEPADRLLERIREERRKQWEERYRRERYESKGKEPPSGWRDRYPTPNEPDIGMLDNLPTGWRWVTLEQLGEWTGGNTPRKSHDEFWEGDIPWVSPKDMKKSEIFDSEDHLTEAAVEDANAKLVPPESILFVSRSGILENSLPVAINRAQVAINQDLKALRLTSSVSSDYVLYWALGFGNEILRDCRKDGTTVASLKSDALYTYPLPLPPRAEQEKIVAEVSRHLSLAEHALETVAQELDHSTSLRQSILKSAFSGKLTSS